MTIDNDNDIFLQLGDAESEAVATVVLSPAAALGSDCMDSMEFFSNLGPVWMLSSGWARSGESPRKLRSLSSQSLLPRVEAMETSRPCGFLEIGHVPHRST